MRARWWVVVAVGAALVGCSTATGGEPAPMTTPPAVPRALDLTAHLSHPCALLEPDDYRTANVVIDPGSGYPTERTADPRFEQRCYATNATDSISLGLSLRPDQNLLVHEYARFENGLDNTVDAGFVDGYPVLFEHASAAVDHKNHGCVISVATAAGQSIQLRYTNLETTDRAASCKLLETLADRVLRRLGA